MYFSCQIDLKKFHTISYAKMILCRKLMGGTFSCIRIGEYKDPNPMYYYSVLSIEINVVMIISGER